MKKSVKRILLVIPVIVFIVIATQNPIEQEGTYLLSEAQQDRFILKEKLEYPSILEELEILNRVENKVFEKKQKVVNLKEVKYLQELCKKVYIDEAIKKYIVNIIQATRKPEKIDKNFFLLYVFTISCNFLILFLALHII